ncbi:serine hydrolase [Nevskia sp.]|uniref:serine hydrolase domain-containing protein n=1 Tax=Nevskia sp. TaxID=1929292 RepID=UPI00260158FB|nr:serine hydrolase domain-containing protein [Nevskia sp.]
MIRRRLAALATAATVALLLPTQAAEPPAAAARFDQAVRAFAKDSHFSGVVLVADDGRPVYRQAFGLANREWRQPNRLDTRFRIASVTKTFTAVLVLQSVEAGRLTLDTTLAEVLPETAAQPFGKVTIHQLLTYSSGLPDTDQTTGFALYQQRLSAAEFVARVAVGDPVTAPGTAFKYKNLDYRLLERVLETVEGQPFPALVAARIAQPLGLRNTFALASEAIVPNLASAYFVDDDQPGVLRADPPCFPETYGAAGSLVSTVGDLLAFDAALRTHRLLNAESTRVMLTSNPSLGYVAYGFWVYPCQVGGQATECAERQGSIAGSNALWLRDLRHGRSFIVLSNSNEADLQTLKGVLSAIR